MTDQTLVIVLNTLKQRANALQAELTHTVAAIKELEPPQCEE